MRWSATFVLAVTLFVVVGSRHAGAEAQCARLLTAAEVEAAAGPGFKDVGKEEPEAGRSECIWLLEHSQNPRAISLTFWQRSAVAGDLAQFFDTQAKRAEGVHGNKREALEGIGTKAALVPGKKPGAMAVLIVQAPDGVAYVETDYLERPQVLRLGQAITAP